MRTNKVLTTAFLTLSTLVAQAAPALAYTTDAGEEAGQGMTILETLAWFVFAPLVVWAIVWFLWSLPKWRRASAPATGDNWDPKPSSAITR